MKRIAELIAIAAATALLAGCAGSFRSDIQFRGYVDSLQLSRLSVAAASSKLSSKGFNCQAPRRPLPQGSVECNKGIGSQIQTVELSPDQNDANRSVVAAYLTFVLAQA
jgi:uncharacterized lipoprotein